MRKFIIVLGYGWTGSSAVIDLLSEYNNTKVFGDHEFRLFKDPGGIIDLENKLKSNWSVLNSNYSIFEFRNLVKRFSNDRTKFSTHNYEYDKKFGIKLEDLCENFVKSLIADEWRGYSFLYEREYSALEFFYQKILRKLKLRDQENNPVVFVSSDVDFREKVRAFTNALHDVLSESSSLSVVLNQALPVCNPASYDDYFENAKVIVVNRDPRDIFMYSHRFSWMPNDPEIFVKWYREQMIYSEKQKAKEKGKVLRLNFEDLVINYSENVKKIENFLELENSAHLFPYECFNPEKSGNNIGLYKSGDKNVNDYLIQQLPEYLYNNQD